MKLMAETLMKAITLIQQARKCRCATADPGSRSLRNTAGTGLIWSGVSLGIVAVLSACGRPVDVGPDVLQKQSGDASSELTVHWPARPDQGADAVTLRIPRRNLLSARGDEKGGVRWLSLKFPLAGSRLTQNEESQSIPQTDGDTPMRVIIVHIDNDATYANAHRESRRSEAISRGLVPDGTVAGLERYSRVLCLADNAPTKEMSAFIAQKESDDTAPTGCRTYRRELILVSPPQVTNSQQGVSIRCWETSCNADFLAAQRRATVQLRHEDLPNWAGIVEPARRLVNSFVVSQSAASRSTASSAQ